MRLHDRVASLEQAVTALARQEFGDRPGHPFRGNQYDDGMFEGIPIDDAPSGGGAGSGESMRDRIARDYMGNGSTPERARERADAAVAVAKKRGITNWEDAKNLAEDLPHLQAQQAAFGRVRAHVVDRAPKRGDLAVTSDGTLVHVTNVSGKRVHGNAFKPGESDSSYGEHVYRDATPVVGVVPKTAPGAKTVIRWIENEGAYVGNTDWASVAPS
jgi:hypothetical protein